MTAEKAVADDSKDGSEEKDVADDSKDVPEEKDASDNLEADNK